MKSKAGALLVLALGLAGFSQWASTSGPPGDSGGTEAMMNSAYTQLVKYYPWLPTQVESLRADFYKLKAEPSDEQVRHVLSILEPCTDMTVEEVQKDPAKRREAAWLLYLDTYAREGPKAAQQLFTTHGPPPKGG
jgi:hypothetical protein